MTRLRLNKYGFVVRSALFDSSLGHRAKKIVHLIAGLLTRCDYVPAQLPFDNLSVNGLKHQPFGAIFNGGQILLLRGRGRRKETRGGSLAHPACLSQIGDHRPDPATRLYADGFLPAEGAEHSGLRKSECRSGEKQNSADGNKNRPAFATGATNCAGKHSGRCNEDCQHRIKHDPVNCCSQSTHR